MNAEHLMLVGGLSAFFLTLWWVRSRQLREKYAVAWMLVATVALVCGLFPELIMSFANRAHLSYPSAVLFVSLTMIYGYAFSVSVSLSQRHHKEVRMAQEIALLEARVRTLEAALREAGGCQLSVVSEASAAPAGNN